MYKLEVVRCIGVCLSAAIFAWADSPDLDRARKLYERAQYRNVIQTLAGQSLAGQPQALEVLGKAYFSIGEYKKAVETFEKAVAADPGNSSYHHWLGRAHGRRAETSNPIMAPSYAGKARNSFEKAVALDPKNVEAINDLFSYYLEAPGFLGGGLDKAAELAKRMEAIDPVEYHYDMAQLAEKRKEFKTAEFHLRQAVNLAPRQVGRFIDLGRFLSNQGRHQESEAVFAQAEKVAPNEPRLLFEKASSYIRAKKNLDAAKLLLERYLKSPLTPDDPPRAEAERLLKQTVAGV